MNRTNSPIIPDSIHRSYDEHSRKIEAAVCLELFKTDGYLIINKTLIKKIGLLPALLMSNYVDKYTYFQSREGFNGCFFLRHSDIMTQLNIKETSVIKAKRELIEQGFIQTKLMGQPAREWIMINFSILYNTIFSDPLKSGGLAPGNFGGLYKELKLKDYNTSNLEKEKMSIYITPDDFDKFWQLYPSSRRGSKGKALTTWMKLCTPGNKFRPEWQRIRAAIIKQKKSDQWQDPEFIPLSTTWLNNKRWLDDPSQLKRYKFDDNNRNESSVNFVPTGLNRTHEKERLE